MQFTAVHLCEKQSSTTPYIKCVHTTLTHTSNSCSCIHDVPWARNDTENSLIGENNTQISLACRLGCLASEHARDDEAARRIPHFPTKHTHKTVVVDAESNIDWFETASVCPVPRRAATDSFVCRNTETREQQNSQFCRNLRCVWMAKFVGCSVECVQRFGPQARILHRLNGRCL